MRIQYGKSAYGGAEFDGNRPDNALPGSYYDQRSYMRSSLDMLQHIRSTFGDRLEILHDVHERLTCSQAVEFAKECEPLRLFFLEDVLPPEQIDWFANIRAVCATPMAMGELFNNPREWNPLITGRLIDYVRMHITQMGGLTPARKVAAMGELCGVRTAWHGPGDVSPVGHMLNVHLDLVSPNFGIQEFAAFVPPDGPPTTRHELQEVFPGCPELRHGYLYPNDKPGLGIDLDEQLAAKYPPIPVVEAWTQTRLPDGSLHRP
jgi:mannonate dehydratase